MQAIVIIFLIYLCYWWAATSALLSLLAMIALGAMVMSSHPGWTLKAQLKGLRDLSNNAVIGIVALLGFGFVIGPLVGAVWSELSDIANGDRIGEHLLVLAITLALAGSSIFLFNAINQGKFTLLSKIFDFTDKDTSGAEEK